MLPDQPPDTPAEPSAPEDQLTSADVPQEDSLATVRRVVKAIADGHEDTQSLAEQSGVSRRHVGYAINAAIILDWVVASEDRLAASEIGKGLLETRPGGIEERAIIRASIRTSKVLQQLAPRLLLPEEPPRGEIARGIGEATGLSPSTCERRERTLLSWRRQALGPQTVPPPPRSAPPPKPGT